MKTSTILNRRAFLGRAMGLAAGGAALPIVGVAQAGTIKGGAVRPSFGPFAMGSAVVADAQGEGLRTLAFRHTHTHERIELAYATEGSYVPDALLTLNRFMRDHYSGTVGQMDPALFDLLHQVRLALGSRNLMPFEVISGYRCPETNSHLRTSRGGGVAKRSLHMEGKAIDVRIPGVPLAELRDAAIALDAGGVGYYPAEQFVHIDTGRVRRWG